MAHEHGCKHAEATDTSARGSRDAKDCAEVDTNSRSASYGRLVWIRRALLVGVVLLVGGCTSVVGGQSAPVGSSESTGIQLPPRPREVRLDGVDPCSLLTAEQRAELGLDRPPVFDLGPSRLYNGEVPLCAIRGFEPRAILV